MIPFSTDLVRFEYVKLKSLTTALGGSLRVVDEEASAEAIRNEEEKTEILIRYKLPYAVARQYQQRNKNVSTYLVPIDACLVWFGDQIVSIESRAKHLRNDDSTLLSGRRWISQSEMNFDKHVVPKITSDNWYTDGAFFYELPENIVEKIENAERLSKDGLFRGVTVSALKYADLDQAQLIQNAATRSIVACVQSNGQVILTPPIWKNVLDVRKGDIKQEEKCAKGRWDLIEENFHVNLEFALNAGKTIGEVFGYDQISPLKLDELMIHLKTVNLPKVPKSVRGTFGIGIPYTHAFGWVAGLTAKCDNMSDFLKMRGLLKQLCTKGIFRSQLIEKVYKDSGNTKSPPMLDKDDALNHVLQNVGSEVKNAYWRNKNDEKTGNVDQSVRNAIGSMVED